MFICRTTMDPFGSLVSSYLHGKLQPTVEKVLYALCMILQQSPLDSQPCCIKPFILSAFKVLSPSRMVSPSVAIAHSGPIQGLPKGSFKWKNRF